MLLRCCWSDTSLSSKKLASGVSEFVSVCYKTNTLNIAHNSRHFALTYRDIMIHWPGSIHWSNNQQSNVNDQKHKHQYIHFKIWFWHSLSGLLHPNTFLPPKSTLASNWTKSTRPWKAELKQPRKNAVCGYKRIYLKLFLACKKNNMLHFYISIYVTV